MDSKTMYMFPLIILLLVVPLHGQMMKCSYGERGSLTATCVYATSTFFRSTTYRFDGLDETVRCLNCHLDTVEANSFDISGNQILTLDLQNSGINVLKDASFVGLVYLKTLYLQYNSIAIIQPGVFRGIKKLEVLQLSNNSLHALVNFGFKELVNLQSLDLSNNLIGTIGASAFMGLGNLKTINLANNKIRDIEEALFKWCLNLVEVNLQNNSIAELKPFDIQNSSIKSLDMSNNNIKALSNYSFSFLQKLETLSLGSNKIESIEPYAFLGLSLLQKLNLENNFLSKVNKGCFSGLVELRELSLASNKLSTLKTGLFSGMPELRYLYLSGNNIVLIELTGVLPLHSLHTLDLSRNNLTDIDYKAMKTRMPKVSYLNLDGNPWPCYLIQEMNDYYHEDNIKLSKDSILNNVTCTHIKKHENQVHTKELILEEAPTPSYVSPYVFYPFMILILLCIGAIFFVLYRLQNQSFSNGGLYTSRANLVNEMHTPEI